MSVRTITTKLALEGEAEYRAKIKNLNADLALHKSELAKVQAQCQSSANSTEALEAKYSALKAQLVDLHKKQMEQTSMVEQAQAAYQKYAQEVAELEKKQKELQNSTESSAEAEKHLQEELDTAKENMQAAANSVTFYQKQLNSTERDQANLKEQLKQTSGYLDEARASADGCATSIDQYGKEVKQAGDSSKDFGDKAKTGIEQLAAVLAAAGIAKSVKEITDTLTDCSIAAEGFEKTVAKIDTIADTSSIPIEEIRAKVLSLSNDSGKAASSVSEAVYQAISSGAATSEAAGTVEKAAKLAAGGFTSVETSVDVLTTSLNAYKLQASETEKISDILITTQKKGKTTVDELAQSVGKVIPLAAAYNVQMDNLGTIYAVLTANGIATAEAGTYTKSMLNELGDSGSKVAGILKEKTGKSFAELSKEGRSVGDILNILGDSVGGSTTAFNELWSSTEAGIGALSLFNSGADHFNSVLDEMQNSAGATEAAYQKMASITEFAHQRMENATDNFVMAIGDQLNPALKQMYENGTDAFSWATDFVNQNPWLVQAVAGAAGAVALLATGLAAYTAAAAAANAVQAALNTTMSLCPVVAVTAAAGALLVVMANAAAKTSEISEGTRKLTKSLKESKAAYEELTAAMKEENDNISSSVKALKELLAAENKSEAQKEAMARIVDQLNEAVPELGLAYDAAADSINMTSSALERMTRNMASQDERSAQVERLSELYTEQQSITDQLAEAQERLDEAMANAQWDSFGGAVNEAAVQVSALQTDVENLTAAQAENAAQTAELEAAVEGYGQQLSGTGANATMMMVEKTQALQKQLVELEAAYQASHDAALESISEQIGLFQEMDGAAKTSIDGLIETLKGQISYMETYSENITKAMELGVDQGLVRKLSDGSEQSAQILAAIVQGGEEDIEELNRQLAKVEEGKDAFAGTIGEMEKEFQRQMNQFKEDHNDAFQGMDIQSSAYNIGWNNVQGIITGTLAQKQNLVNTYSQMGLASAGAYKNAVQQHSPSKIFYEAGSYDIKGLISGAESEKDHLKSAYIDLAETSTLGVAEGLASSGDKVVQEANNLASEVYSRNKSWLDKQTKYQKLTLREQLEVWEAIQSQFIKESKQYAQAEEEIFDLKSKMQDEYCKKVEEVNKKITELEKNYQDTLASRTKEIFNSYKLFDAAPELEEVSGRELIGNLQSQIERMEDFYTGLRDLSARGVGDALVEEIRAMGPSAMSQLDALLELSDLKLTEYADLYKKKQRLANQQAIEELQPLREETNRQIQESMKEMSAVYAQLAPAVGTSFTDAVAAGITSGSATMADAADTAAREAVAAAEQAMAGAVKTIGGVSYDPHVDYSALMASAKSLEEFEALAAQRNAKIIGENLDLVGKGFADNSQLLAKWQASMNQANEKTTVAIASMAESISCEMQNLIDSAPDMGADFVQGLIDGIDRSSAKLNQTVGRMIQDMRACMEAEFQPVQKQIAQSMSNLAENRAFESQAERANMAQAVSNAVREALSGVSVNMNQRKVGELVTNWQDRNNKSRGE